MPEEQVGFARPYLTYEQMNLINDYRYFLHQMPIWARALAISLKHNLPNANSTFARFLQVPSALYSNVSTFYGMEAAEQLVNLLTQHIIVYRDLALALINKNHAEANANLAKWFQNADDIADFMARLNLYWDREQVRNLLYQYKQMLYTELQAIVSGNDQWEIQIHDRAIYHSTLIADYIARGLLHNLTAIPRQKVSSGSHGP